MPSIAYGYARVSSKDQNLDRQLDALWAFPIDKSNVYADKASGKDFERPMYKRLMEAMRPGDVLVVKSIDRLDLKLMALVVRARVHVDDLVLLGVVAISELREVGEDSAVAHVVAVDHDEGRVERALAVDEGRAVSALP